jgi:hypothetical protein
LGASDFGASIGKGVADLGAEALEGDVQGEVGERLAVVCPTNFGGEDLKEVAFYGGIEFGVIDYGE